MTKPLIAFEGLQRQLVPIHIQPQVGKFRHKDDHEVPTFLSSQFWQRSASVGGKDRVGLLKSEELFRRVAEQFLKEYEIITEGHRSPRWVDGHGIRLRLSTAKSFSQDQPCREG